MTKYNQPRSSEEKTTRRQMLKKVSGGGVLGLFGLTGFLSWRNSSGVILPMIGEVILEEIVEIIKSHFGGEGSWDAGQLAESCPNVSGVEARPFGDTADEELRKKFKARAAVTGVRFESPLLELVRDCTPIGIAQMHTKEMWLMLGYNSSGPFWVNRMWVEFLLDDTCALKLAADTLFDERCPFDPNCKVRGCKQEFKHLNGHSQVLFTAGENRKLAKYEWESHSKHCEPFGGCELIMGRPQVGSGDDDE